MHNLFWLNYNPNSSLIFNVAFVKFSYFVVSCVLLYFCIHIINLQDPGIRAWLLMNLHEDPSTGRIGWRMNLDSIHKSFETDIINFPFEKFESKVAFDKRTLFVGGGNSEYIPVHDHPDILELFPRAGNLWIFMKNETAK